MSGSAWDRRDALPYKSFERTRHVDSKSRNDPLSRA
jgi:hypothetical protein